MKIVVGLGNPGKKYAGTRHNIGFDVLLELHHQFSGESWKSKFEAEIAEITIDSERVLLAGPQTYMNLSGRSVRQIAQFYKATLADLLVVCDDMNLPTGQLRLRSSGSSGGQKGVQNIIDQLGSQEFARLRFGVGRPPAGFDAANYVLQRFAKSEEEEIRQAVQRSSDAVSCWVRDGIDQAMNQYNTKV